MRVKVANRRNITAKVAAKYRATTRSQKGQMLYELAELTDLDRHYLAWKLQMFGKRRQLTTASGETVSLIVGRPRSRSGPATTKHSGLWGLVQGGAHRVVGVLRLPVRQASGATTGRCGADLAKEGRAEVHRGDR